MNSQTHLESGSGATGPLLAVVGSINIDLTMSINRLPAPGETVLADSFGRAAGGKGGNQAAAAAQLLGRGVTLVGAVGSDSEGRRVLQQLDRFGVDTSGTSIVDGVPTGMAMISVDSAGENTIVVNPGANGHAFPEGAALPPADGYVLSLEIPLADARRALRQMVGIVALNASPAQRLPEEFLERADLIVVNETEFQSMPELNRAREVVETRGGDGVRVHHRGVVVAELPAVRAERVVSTVGAGDAFCGALVAGRLSGLTTEQATRVAAHVGAATVAQPNAQPTLHSLAHYEQLASG